jgi:hypothetical protein
MSADVSSGTDTLTLPDVAQEVHQLNKVELEWISPRDETPIAAEEKPSRWARLRVSVWPWLILIGAGQSVSALWPKRYNHTAFEDEGLYVYMGHQVIAHLFHGRRIVEYPGSYFSGAPGFYPVFAAIGDYFGGIEGARFVSLIFAIVAMIGVCGLGTQLFGKVAGVVGALAFSLTGSVIMLSHFATYDACMMAFVASAAWLGTWSAKRDGLMWSPVVAALLTCAFMAKYAGGLYTPVVALLVAAAGYPKYGKFAIRQALSLVLQTVALTFAILAIFGRSMFPGIKSTTLTRHIISYGSTKSMLVEVYHWIGPWLIIGAIGALLLILMRRSIPVVLTLAFASVVGVAQQVHIHEQTSFSKHVGFGIMFAAPLIGALFASLIDRRQWLVKAVGVALVPLVFGYFLQPNGWVNSKAFLTFWPQDQALVTALETYYKEFPNKHILGEAPSPEKYAMRKIVKNGAWNDTYQLYYKKLRGEPAYRLAVLQDHFGIIYLSYSTAFGHYVGELIADKVTLDYKLRAKIPRYLRGKPAGYWLVFTLKTPTNGG